MKAMVSDIQGKVQSAKCKTQNSFPYFAFFTLHSSLCIVPKGARR